MRYIINLSYDGSAFCGWQVQNNARTVQGELEKALKTLLRSDVPVTGAGRTDSGVNASGYVAHFDFEDSLPIETGQLAYKLNAILPDEIIINEIAPADSEFHARFSAKVREYHYFIHKKRDPFCEKFSWRCRYPLDVEKMNRAAALLLGEHDFSCFEKTGGNNATSICTVYEAVWEEYKPMQVSVLGTPCDKGDYIVFRIRANRFLRNMVRAIVGSLVEIGRGKQEPEWILTLLENGDRCEAGESVPGNALFLSKVEY